MRIPPKKHQWEDTKPLWKGCHQSFCISKIDILPKETIRGDHIGHESDPVSKRMMERKLITEDPSFPFQPNAPTNGRQPQRQRVTTSSLLPKLRNMVGRNSSSPTGQGKVQHSPSTRNKEHNSCQVTGQWRILCLRQKLPS